MYHKSNQIDIHRISYLYKNNLIGDCAVIVSTSIDILNIFKDIFGVNFDSPFRKVDFTFNLLELIDDSSSLDESKTPFGLIKDFFVNEKTQNSVFRNNQGFLNDQESWSNEKWFIRERIISLVKLWKVFWERLDICWEKCKNEVLTLSNF